MAKNPRAPTARKGIANKLVLGFASAVAVAVVGSAGVAAAHPLGSTVSLPNKAACANYKMYHFKNRGLCVSAYEHALKQKLGNPGNGHGYGGSPQISTAVTVNVKGDNNVIDVAVNYFIGH